MWHAAPAENLFAADSSAPTGGPRTPNGSANCARTPRSLWPTPPLGWRNRCPSTSTSLSIPWGPAVRSIYRLQEMATIVACVSNSYKLYQAISLIVSIAEFESVSQIGQANNLDERAKIREYVEQIVAEMLGGNLDQIKVGQLSKSENCKYSDCLRFD